MKKIFRLITALVLCLFLLEVLEASEPFVRACLRVRQSHGISFVVHAKLGSSTHFKIVKKGPDSSQKSSTKKIKGPVASHHAVPQGFSTFENRMPISLWTPVFVAEIPSPPLQSDVRPPKSCAAI